MTKIRYIDGSLVGDKYKPDIIFEFKIAIPEADTEEYALIVDHDGLNEANVSSMLRLADEGKAPYTVSIGVAPGRMLMPDGSVRGMRMNSYDLFDREYGDFLVHELIPYVEKMYALKLLKSPDMHMVSGGSSGGVSAFVIAWFHSDYFHRVYMSSPSFLAMGRGNELPYLIRKYETKPLRIYMEYSEKEPNDYFGWSNAIDREAEAALKYAKYNFECEYFQGEGHCSRCRNEEHAYKRNEWLWKDYSSISVLPLGNSPRVDTVVSKGSVWERCEAFPIKEKVPSVLAKDYCTTVLSNDAQAWYAANGDEDIVYMHLNKDNMSYEKRILHATLHTIPRVLPKGAIDMAVSKTDRLFVLTAIGIQCVRSFGLVDVILELPDDANPLEIAVSDALYVRTEKGIYKRMLCKDCVTDNEVKRKNCGYYD